MTRGLVIDAFAGGGGASLGIERALSRPVDIAINHDVIHGDCLDVLPTLAAGSVQTCITSPPYWGLRDYGHDGQLGLEATPDEYVARMVAVFREVRRALRDDGTLWLNLGDSYIGGGRGGNPDESAHRKQATNVGSPVKPSPIPNGLKPKDLAGIPWRVALALQADGWWLRQDIIWHKPNPMPESVTDRCTKSHEYIFLLSKRERYYYDAAAINEPVTISTIKRVSQPTLDQQAGSDRVPGKTNGPMKAVLKRSGNKARKDATERGCPESGVCGNVPWEGASRNKRSVWTVTTKPFKGAHFATFPPDLIEPCVLAGCPVGGVVLDPFGGSGTTGAVAVKHGRRAALIEINPEYVEIARKRIAAARERHGLFVGGTTEAVA